MEWVGQHPPAVLAAWSWITQNWAALAITATCLSLLAFVVGFLGKYVRICLNIFIDTPPPLSMGPRDFPVIQGEQTRFRGFDGTSLRGMWVRPKNPRAVRGTIVFCHEFGSDMFSFARYTRPLIEAGFNVFTFDFRAHGESSRPRKYRPLQWPSDKELEDVLGACAYVEDLLESAGSSPRIGVFSISRGAGAALLAASSDHNIAAVACDGAFSTRETLVTLMKRWAYIFAKVKLVYEYHPDAYWRFLLGCMMWFAERKLGRRFPSVSKALRNMVSRPILFIHGRRDSYIRPEQAHLLHRITDGPKYLWIVDGAKHNQSVVIEPAEYAARTVAFFRRHLAGEALPDAEITSPRAAPGVA